MKKASSLPNLKRYLIFLFLFFITLLVMSIVFLKSSNFYQPTQELTTVEASISEEEAIKIVRDLPEVQYFLSQMEKLGTKTGISAVNRIQANGDTIWNVRVYEVHELNRPTFNIYFLDGKTGKILYSTPQVFDETGNFVCVTDIDNRSCYISE